MDQFTENRAISDILMANKQDIASAWVESIVNTSYVPLSVEEIGDKLATLTKIAITAITKPTFDKQMAREIGVSLVKMHFTQPEALGNTLATLSNQLLTYVSDEELPSILPQVIELNREIGIGFTHETHKIILKEQQELREAMEKSKSEIDRARRQLELRNRAILSALPDAMYVLNLEGEFRDFHAKRHQSFMSPSEILEGKNLKDLLPEKLVENFFKLAQKAIQTGEVQVLIGSMDTDGETFHYEFRIVPYLESQVLTIVRDISQRVRLDAELKEHRENLEELIRERTRQLSLTNQKLRLEIEERLLAEERLRESKEQLEVIVNGVADGIVLMDSNLRRLIANPAAASTYGFQSVEEYLEAGSLIDKFEIMYENGDPVPRDQLPLFKAARGEEFAPMMLRYRHKGSHEELWSLVQATPIFDNHGQIRFIVMITHDFTEHKKAEEDLRKARSDLEKRVRERTAQLETLNHQLQLLTGQLINAQENERRSIARDLHDVVLSQIGAALIMMDDETSIDLVRSKLTSLTDQIRNIINGLRPQMLNFGLGSAIDELSDDLIDQAVDGTKIQVDVNANGVRYDPEVELHIYRILQQACNNAMRHAQATQIEIRGDLNPEGGMLVVKDNGIGMELAHELNLSRSLGNKHYGLASMFERAELIGARLSIDSRIGEGTHVKLIW